MSYKDRYNLIVKDLVKKSFPILKDKRFFIFEFNVTSLYGVYIPILNFIGLNKKCRGFSDKLIRGMLVHELCHVEYSKIKGIFWSGFFFIFYWFSRKLRGNEEIRADKSVVEKGYARELFELTKKIERDHNLDNVKYGFSSKDIINYAKEIGKW